MTGDSLFFLSIFILKNIDGKCKLYLNKFSFDHCDNFVTSCAPDRLNKRELAVRVTQLCDITL